MAIALNNSIHYWSARIQNGPVGSFTRWWLAELKQLLPASWRERLQHAMRRVVLQLEPGQLRLGTEENRVIEWFETFSLEQDVPLQRQQLRGVLENQELKETPRFLLLDQGSILRKELVLPQAAESSLQQVLAFEMDRQTPFRAADVYYTWRPLGSDRNSGQIRVELFVIPRKSVDGMLELLAARGLAPGGVDVVADGASLGINLLPAEKRFKVINRRTRLNAGLAAAVLVLLLMVMVQSLNTRATRLEHLETAIADVQDEARRVQRLREQVAETGEAASFLTRRRAAAPLAVELLADVTRILPDDTYLDRLVMSQGTVLLQGKSRNAQQLIEVVNKSETFDNAEFRGSTRLDAATGLEIFEINADVITGSGS